MTKEEFLSLKTGDVVRVDYNGIIADYFVEDTPDSVVLRPEGIELTIPKESVEKWNISSITKRRGKSKSFRAIRKTETGEE